MAAMGCLATLIAPRAEAAGSGQLGILDTSGVNPQTGVEWAVGDAYRLVFISSGRVDPKDSSLGDFDLISTWNAQAQLFANSSDLNLGRVSWKIIGSTVDTDAKTNTKTDPALDGLGHPIMLIDGSTVIARDFEDLWDGEIQNTITMTEQRGLSIFDVEAPHYPFTGTRPDGTALLPDQALRHLSQNRAKIRQGQADQTKGWIDRNAIAPPAKDDEPMPIYAISRALSVIPRSGATDEIPETSTFLLIGLTSLALLRRKKRA